MSEWVIFCVGQTPYKISAFKAFASHQKLAFKALKGCYKGVTEDSFLISLRDYEKVREWTQDEDSVLYLGMTNARNQRPAFLEYSDGIIEDLGLFTSVSRDEALKCDGWTYDPTTDIYYTCV